MVHFGSRCRICGKNEGRAGDIPAPVWSYPSRCLHRWNEQTAHKGNLFALWTRLVWKSGFGIYLQRRCRCLNGFWAPGRQEGNCCDIAPDSTGFCRNHLVHFWQPVPVGGEDSACYWQPEYSFPDFIIYKVFDPEETRRLVERFEWHYTPKYGNWLEIGIMSR